MQTASLGRTWLCPFLDFSYTSRISARVESISDHNVRTFAKQVAVRDGYESSKPDFEQLPDALPEEALWRSCAGKPNESCFSQRVDYFHVSTGCYSVLEFSSVAPAQLKFPTPMDSDTRRMRFLVGGYMRAKRRGFH